MALADFKVDIFSGINDTPRGATAELAGNGSDLINRLNGLVDFLIAAKKSSVFRFILGQASTGDVGGVFAPQETEINTIEVGVLDPGVSITVLFPNTAIAPIVLDDTNYFYQYNPGELVIPADTLVLLSISGSIPNNTVVDFGVTQSIFA